MQDHILIVDDDRQETTFLERFFKKNGYRATGVFTATEMFAALNVELPHLIVLDLILPDEDGLDAARRLQKDHDIPIIMLSARNEVFDRIVGLEVGADDYVTKPYEPHELLARVRSVLRRYKKGGAPVAVAELVEETLQVGDLKIDFVRQSVAQNSTGDDLRLTHAEFVLLRAIVSQAGAVVSRAVLVEQMYGDNPNVTDRAIDAHIVRLRRKLAKVPQGDGMIATVHGAGYRFVRLADASDPKA